MELNVQRTTLLMKKRTLDKIENYYSLAKQYKNILDDENKSFIQDYEAARSNLADQVVELTKYNFISVFVNKTKKGNLAYFYRSEENVKNNDFLSNVNFFSANNIVFIEVPKKQYDRYIQDKQPRILMSTSAKVIAEAMRSCGKASEIQNYEYFLGIDMHSLADKMGIEKAEVFNYEAFSKIKSEKIKKVKINPEDNAWFSVTNIKDYTTAQKSLKDISKMKNVAVVVSSGNKYVDSKADSKIYAYNGNISVFKKHIMALGFNVAEIPLVCWKRLQKSSLIKKVNTFDKIIRERDVEFLKSEFKKYAITRYDDIPSFMYKYDDITQSYETYKKKGIFEKLSQEKMSRIDEFMKDVEFVHEAISTDSSAARERRGFINWCCGTFLEKDAFGNGISNITSGLEKKYPYLSIFNSYFYSSYAEAMFSIITSWEAL